MVLFLISICRALAEYCPDCGKVVVERSSQCLICGFKLQELRLWLEGQKRFIPGLQDPHKRYFCPYCSKIHKREHFHCFHCGKKLLERTTKVLKGNPKSIQSDANQSMHSLLQRSRKDPGSLTKEEKGALVKWIQQRPLAALFTEKESDSAGGIGSLHPFPNKMPGAPKPTDFLMQQLQSMLGDSN